MVDAAPSALEELVPAEVFAAMVHLRRDLHRHPELSWAEHRTMGRIAGQLEALGVAHRRGVAGTGVVAELPGPAGVPAVLLRADMDALPVEEETGLDFASEVPGVMHACGHDGHSSMLMGAARLLAAGPPLPAPVRLAWQPAEELGAGASAMIAEGLLEGVGAAFGGHLDRRFPVGTLVVTEGAVNASTDTFRIVVHGQGAHGARPHEGVDAIVVGSLLVTALQSIVSREVDPGQPAVVSVGRFSAGSAPNVIAGRAELEGTLRAQDPAVRARLRAGIRRIADSVGSLNQARVEVELREGTPALLNRPRVTRLARRAAEELVGAERVVPLGSTNMGGEDFACFLQQVPGCYIRFGGRPPGGVAHPAHSGRFDFDEAALAVGAAWLARVARQAGEALAAGDSLREPAAT